MKLLKFYYVLAALLLSVNIQAQISDTDFPVNQLILNEDLMVKGSGCIGIDCPDAPVFGFHTIRLMENNLRIAFDDTSASGTFPANDWEITINDTANGGTNFFGVTDVTANTSPFKIMAGAGNNALYVSGSGGNVGLGTNAPVVELHITDGDSPTLRLEQNGASGWTSQTWDVAGNETNFFIRDVTGGSNLPFKIKPGAPNDVVFIAATGALGVNNASPNGNASLDLGATNKGLILNRLTNAERTTLSGGAVAGMMVYDTEDNATYTWDGAAWVEPGSDNQNMASATLLGTTLTVAIENGTSVDVDLAPILSTLQAENSAQQAQIDDLLARMTALEQCACGGTLHVPEVETNENSIQLGQNVPNPFNTQSEISYFIPSKYRSAKIVLTSSLGQVISSAAITQFGKAGSLSIQKAQLQSAIYYYTLYVDGKKNETKRLIVK
tara:strand:- start:32256 stop:33575 length:1320 start_codon:yes stop_codon:yes gene_type:complete